MTDHHDRLAALLHVLGLQGAAADRVSLEKWKEFGRHARSAHTFSFIARAEKDATGNKRGDLFERLALRLPVSDVRNRHVAFGNSLPRIDTEE
jgi:hypothetical protein